jgi:hypothetical protein
MKIRLLCVIFIFLSLTSAYCGGLTEKNLVNRQEIELGNINAVDIAYSWENIALMESDTDRLIIKEYMSIDNSDYYAHISNSENRISVEKGKRPFGIGTGILFNTYNARVEVCLPKSFTKSISIKTAGGNISIGGDYLCSEINLECSSGNIRVERITADSVICRAASGNIQGGSINGSANLRTSSGNIKFERINGSVHAESASGSIRCGVTENAANISLVTASGGVTLYLPVNFSFAFQSRTSSGSLSTPFSDRLFSPITDRHSAQGIVGDNSGNTINIRTSSGSIKVSWIQ